MDILALILGKPAFHSPMFTPGQGKIYSQLSSRERELRELQSRIFLEPVLTFLFYPPTTLSFSGFSPFPACCLPGYQGGKYTQSFLAAVPELVAPWINEAAGPMAVHGINAAQ
jgi:hypothetical protein